MNDLEREVRNLLDGIDRDELDQPEGGWWETASGVEFGKSKLDALIKLINEHLGQYDIY